MSVAGLDSRPDKVPAEFADTACEGRGKVSVKYGLMAS